MFFVEKKHCTHKTHGIKCTLYKQKKKEKDWANCLKRFIHNCDNTSTSDLLKIKEEQLNVLYGKNASQNVNSRIMAHDVWCLIQLIMVAKNTQKKTVQFDDCIWMLKMQLNSFMQDSIIGNALKQAIL